MPVFYRYEDHGFESRVQLIKFCFHVISTTDTGVWLDVHGKKRFVKLDARKHFACPTKAEALESFRARKQRQISILRYQLKKAETALTLNENDSPAYFGDDTL